MRTLQTLLALLLTISCVTAQGSYAPINVTCPSNLVRSGETGLSPDETAYISKRKTKATQSLQTWLAGVNLQDFNVSTFLANESNVPTMAIAFSGGGYRAMLNGAGVFQGPPPLPRSPLCVDVDAV
jgi:lysophospholipase